LPWASWMSKKKNILHGMEEKLKNFYCHFTTVEIDSQYPSLRKDIVNLIVAIRKDRDSIECMDVYHPYMEKYNYLFRR